MTGAMQCSPSVKAAVVAYGLFWHLLLQVQRRRQKQLPPPSPNLPPNLPPQRAPRMCLRAANVPRRLLMYSTKWTPSLILLLRIHTLYRFWPRVALLVLAVPSLVRAKLTQFWQPHLPSQTPMQTIHSTSPQWTSSMGITMVGSACAKFLFRIPIVKLRNIASEYYYLCDRKQNHRVYLCFGHEVDLVHVTKLFFYL